MKPLKPRLDFLTRRIELQVQRLEQSIDRFSMRDKTIFARIVDAKEKHDAGRASVFSSELVEIRKMEKTIINSKIALTNILVKLHSVSTVGDVVNMGPVISVLRSIRTGLVSIFPETDSELGEVSNALSGMIVEAGQETGATLNFNTVNEEATKILTETADKTEQVIKEKFPEIPS